MMLVISILALLAGPPLYAWVRRHPGWLALTDSFVFVVVGGLVLFHILPEVIHAGGWQVLLLVALGLFGPTLFENLFRRAALQMHNATLLVGVLGLALHALGDGAALVDHGEAETHGLLALSVVLHRIPVGLTVWWLLRPQYGRVLAWLVIILMSVTTYTGFAAGEQLVTALDSHQFAWFQAFVVGAILHVVFHRPYHVESAEPTPTMTGVGGLLGVVALLLILLPGWLGYHLHEHHEEIHHLLQDAAPEAQWRFLYLALSVAPWLLLAYAIAAMINYLFPRAFWLSPRPGRLPEALRGALLGLPLPVCIPDATRIYPMLLKQGATPSFALAFLVASPVFGFDALLVSLPLLGLEFTGIRLLAALALTLLVGTIVGRFVRNVAMPEAELSVEEPRQHSAKRLFQAFTDGYAHLIDHTAPWVIVGLVVAATLAPTPGWDLLAEQLWAQFLLVMLLALPLHLCATGLTPVVTVLLAVGLSPAAGLLFLLLGPMVNLTLVRFLIHSHGRGIALAMVVAMVCLSAMISWFAQPWLVLPPWLPDTETTVWQWLALGVLVALYAISLLRNGPRAFIAELLPSELLHHHHHHHHDANHGHHHHDGDHKH
ncbi:permease [Corallincola luteus]|uniref:Permease n=1 Tax=Corallincola luteus TaxID=1775177 RepID=A0ABY2AMI9_9GAMM|nr:permease [Corallincola luteus]TCI04414.1 permease [Corallincola luteus]